MPRRFEMGDLVTRCRKRCDLVNNDVISNDEFKALISEQYGDLYAAVAGTGLRYFETESTITADGSDSYDEPEDHLSTVGVDYVVDSGGRREELSEFMPPERTYWIGSTGSRAVAYAIVDDQIYLYPKPSSGTYKLLYVPQPPDLSSYADADPVDLVIPAGEAFLIWGVVVKALGPLERDVRLAIAERDKANTEVIKWAVKRALTQPRRPVMVDPEDPSWFDPGGWRYG